jgi:hypothetical protein
MQTYRSPVYPALMVKLPGETRRDVKASGGYFQVEDEDVEAFEAFIATRPHYRITPADAPGPWNERRVVSPDATDDEASDALSEEEQAAAEAARVADNAVTQPEAITDIERHPENVAEENLDSFSIEELQAILTEMGLETNGRKAVLIKRIVAAREADAPDESEQE